MNLPILMYHKVLPEPDDKINLTVTVTEFEKQMKYLKAKGYESILPRDLNAGRLPRKPFIITFDDAYINVLQYAKPVLDACGFRAVIYVVSDFLGTYNAWDYGKTDLPKTACLSSWHLKELLGSGWEIGCHSKTHANLVELDGGKLEEEIAGAKQVLEKELGVTVTSFCYPFGTENAKVVETVKAAGFTNACAISPATGSVTEDLLRLRRVHVKTSDTLAQFARKISWWYLWYRGMRKR